jgi:hypothetical protein
MADLKAEGARETQGKRTARAAVAAWPRWEEGDGADARAPSVSGWKREEEEGKGIWAARDRWARRGSWASEEKKGWRKELDRSLASWAALS